MKQSKTREVYNDDVTHAGGYLYTRDSMYSSKVATQRQTDEIHALARQYVTSKTNILDVGCGDGIYTFQLLESLHPRFIHAFDITDVAIRTAKKKVTSKQKPYLQFTVGDIYSLTDSFHPGQFQLGVVRGVLHHLEHPRRAIQQLGSILDTILVLEPNGYNPIMKVIEKVSPYHRAHGERSYWPPSLDTWFKQVGFEIAEQKFFSVVPYFFPERISRFLKSIEPAAESVPFLHNIYCGSVLTMYKKK